MEIALSTSNASVIRSVVVFAEGIFEGESLVLHPREKEVGNTARVAVMPPKVRGKHRGGGDSIDML